MKIFLIILFITIAYSSEPSLLEHSLQVYGNASLGYYYVKIFVGHPPQEQTVIIDTGSGQLAIPCNKCTRCSKKHINPPFDMSKSKTAEYITCQNPDPQCKHCSTHSPTQSCTFSISYAQGSSLSGIIIKDSIQFQSTSQNQQIFASFGCTTTQTNLFLKQQANGIFGLAPERTSRLLEELYKKHHDFSGEELGFSLCLASDGGSMVVGAGDRGGKQKEKDDVVKVGYSQHRNLYSLNDVRKLSIGDVLIHQEGQKFGYYGIFVDSGSTFTYFPRQKYDIFKNELFKKCSIHKNQCQIAQGQSTLCFHLMGTQQIQQKIDKIFDPILIQISDSILEWQPSKYFLLRDKKNRQICLGIEALDRYLLGANWMINRKIIFNLKDKHLLIYNNVDCGKRQKSIRQMSQYTNKIQGHQPLNYKSSNGFISSINITIKLTFGIILTFFGTLGLVLIIVKRNQRKQRERLTHVSPIQTQQNIQELSNS